MNYQFQCSSASRKFLNRYEHTSQINAASVSVLFSEPKIPQYRNLKSYKFAVHVSVLFSEPKIPQSDTRIVPVIRGIVVSVLFSEPKIPQWREARIMNFSGLRFQCSSASRKFLNGDCRLDDRISVVQFQCSSASRKFLNSIEHLCYYRVTPSFSALQRAENSSIVILDALPTGLNGFSALQRAENSSTDNVCCEHNEQR